ncbi:MAG: class I SAM-dependent methyltransferase [Acidimicrobiia bacterium]|nr:class I SAM-dependent methyltransferase [Acidimicrobiia bacterium]MDX2468665.1 class I SAM-dependent methyltransferase [Acidimicrobiia bacterium]
MGADSFDVVVRAVSWTGTELDTSQIALLERFHRWLAEEALVAGGLGPLEEDRLWARHIADSLVFGIAIHSGTRCLDIGSGVGLPGIPLAIAHPAASFVLLDRSGRRCDLMRRAVAVLGLDNCEVVQRDVASVTTRFESIVSRAAIPPVEMVIHVKRLIAPGGVALLALSRSATATNPLTKIDRLASSIVVVPADILDTGAKLLRIEAT